MASNGTATHSGKGGSGGKRMDYKPVSGFDVNEIAPDAPAGEWTVSIPRGQCKVQPTKDDKLPMVVVPVRLEKTDEDGDDFQKALGTSLTVYLVFGQTNPRAARMSKLRIRQLCEAADVDLDVLPKDLTDPENDLQPLIHALEGKKFQAWTRHQTRKDTGETTTEIQFQNPNAPIGGGARDDDDGDGDHDHHEDHHSGKGGSKTGKGGKKR